MTSTQADETAIRKVIEDWMTASKAGDTERVLSLMTDSALFMVPGREPFGKEQFRRQSEEMKNMKVDGSATVLEVSVHGDTAWCRTQLEVTITPAEGNPVTRKGYALTVFKKNTSGQWQLHRDANLLAG
jgi:uncharacterized protein (TIGR02246 family)